MDSSKISRLAEGARNALMDDVRNNLQRVLRPQSDERLAEPNAVRELENFVKDRGEEKAVEEIAYTWFNRLCALRFMDMRGYTPVGCVTSRPGSNLPAILADAREGAFAGALKLTQTQKDEVSAILSGAKPSSNPLGGAYVLLLLAACDSYKDAMGYLFSGDLQKRAAMRLLAPSDLLSEQSVMHRICTGMDAEACESVEVLGWLYQFYIAERKKEVFDSKKKYSGVEEIGPVTQLFTPNWIVRYLVDNSVGRLWMLNNPGSDVRSKMEFFVEPEGETEDFIKVYGPEDITVCDPACGSGHILVYAFDLLFEMYLEEGYRSDQIPQLILENNLFGFEIDERAAEIASFALEMKAREKDPSFFEKCVDANITVLEPVEFGEGELKGAGKIIAQRELLDAFEHMDEIGSLYIPADDDLRLIDEAIEKLRDEDGVFANVAIEKLAKMRKIVDVLGCRYLAVVANPPYMSTGSLAAWAKKWVADHYRDSKTDLCTCFITRGLSLADKRAHCSMITMQSWMFLSSYSSFRKRILETTNINSLVHLGTGAFESIGGKVVATAISVLQLCETGTATIPVFSVNKVSSKGAYLAQLLKQGPSTFFEKSDVRKLPGWMISYWATEDDLRHFEKDKPLEDYIDIKQGMATSDNDRFLRLWHEISIEKIGRGLSKEEALASSCKWFPYNKGGSPLSWAGKDDFVVNYENDGAEMKEFHEVLNKEHPGGRLKNQEYYFREGFSWSTLSDTFSVRYSSRGFLFDTKGSMGFARNDESILPFIGLLNSSTGAWLAKILAPTLDFNPIALKGIPFDERLLDQPVNEALSETVIECATLVRNIWNEDERAFDFEGNHLIGKGPSIEVALQVVEDLRNEQIERIGVLEHSLDKIVNEVYEIDAPPLSVYPKDKLLYEIDRLEEVKDLLSYAVGCIMGRYSANVGGLVLARQGSTLMDYKGMVGEVGYIADADGIVPVLDEEWFEDDVVSQTRRWLADAFDAETLDANLAYIEKVLGKNLRDYFTHDFYDDHTRKYYQKGAGKRPIYWLIQSPKKSFQALVYMHRMDKDTIAKVLTDYVQPFRRKLNAQVQVLRATGVNHDAAKADKYQAVIQEMIDWERDVLYPMSQQHIEIDLDDGVKKNYPKFKGAVAKVQGLL